MNKIVPDLIPAVPYHASFMMLATNVLSNRYPALSGEPLSLPPNSRDSDYRDYFLVGYLRNRMFQENPPTLRELQIAIHLEIEAVSTETLMMVSNHFIFRLLEFVIVRNIIWNMS
jgi:hypothetical protein